MIEIRESKIHGDGVFATQVIAKGRRIFAYEGRVIDQNQADLLSSKAQDGYLFDLENGNYIDGDRSKPSSKINHSCTPNCHVRFTKKEIRFYSNIKIKKNVELTFDYAYEPDYRHVICQCGKSGCRGSINLNYS